MNDELKSSVGRKIRKIRKSLGFTQEKMVAHFNVGRANYSRIEKGEVSPSLTILHALNQKFNVSLDWLIGNKGSMFIRDHYKKNLKDKVYNDDRTLGQCNREVTELLTYLEKVPMVKHAVLCYFLEYKLKHQEMIQEYLNKSDFSEQGIAVNNGSL